MKNLFKKIWDFIVSIPKDKLLHLEAAQLICIYSLAVLLFFLCPWLAFIIANGIALLALILKEVYDYFKPGHSVEWQDIVYGFAGMILIDIPLFVIVLLCLRL